ncbi:MAG: ATP-binding protein [Ferruginibacter sp.]
MRQALKVATTDSAKYFKNSHLITYYAERNRDSALYFNQNCMALSAKNGNQISYALELGFKAYQLSHLGKLGESYKCFAEAFAIAKNTATADKTSWNYKKSQTDTARLNLLGDLHIRYYLLEYRNRNKKDLFHLYEARKIAAQINDTISLIETYKFEAWALLDQKKFDSAYIIATQTEAKYQKIGFTVSLSEIYMIKGRVNLHRGNYKQALENIHTGVQWAYDDNDLDDVMRCYTLLAEFYLEKEPNKDSSLLYSKKHLQVLQQIGSAKLGPAYLSIYKSYKLNKNTDSAYKYLQLAATANDSAYEARIKSLSEFQEMAFDDQLRLQQLEKEKIGTQNKIRTYAMLAGLGVFLLIGLFLYRNNRRKQKANLVLQQQKDKVEHTLQELKSTQTQLIQSEKMASLGELTAGFAHEIQNPLNFVNNFSEVSNELIDEMKDELQKGNQEDAFLIADDIKQNLEKINHHGKRADAIVKGMLQHSQKSSGQKEPTDINALCDEYLRLSYHGLRAKDKSFNATIKTDFDTSIGKINIIPQDIGRVILNLLTNAFYAAPLPPEGGFKDPHYKHEPTVTIRTSKIPPSGGGGALISVSDNGPGIPQKVLDKIFQPFFTTKPTGQGTGLGLSLSYDIIKAHSGEIKIETKEGEGTSFIITLPA